MAQRTKRIELQHSDSGVLARASGSQRWHRPAEMLDELLGGLDPANIAQIDLVPADDGHGVALRQADGTPVADLTFATKDDAIAFAQALSAEFDEG